MSKYRLKIAGDRILIVDSLSSSIILAGTLGDIVGRLNNLLEQEGLTTEDELTQLIDGTDDTLAELLSASERL